MSDFGDFITTGDHARGCAGREYACTCGYDDAKDAEILRLRAELAALREPAGDLVEVAKAAIEHVHSRDGIVGAVLDAVLPRVRAEGWRTMESAPLDGMFLLANAAREVCPCQSHDGRRIVSNMPGFADWTYGAAATAWRPLPPPPDAAP